MHVPAGLPRAVSPSHDREQLESAEAVARLHTFTVSAAAQSQGQAAQQLHQAAVAQALG